MKWLHTTVIFIIISGMAIISAHLIVGTTTMTEQLETTNTDTDTDYEYSADELKHVIETHLSFHKKIRITLKKLLNDVKQYLKNEDADGLQETTDALLDRYGASINKAAKALKAEDIKNANIFLSKATEDLENLYAVQKVLIDLRNGIMPRNNSIIRSA